MKFPRNSIHLIALALLVAVLAPLARAQVKITDADLTTFNKLEYAERLFSERQMWARDNPEKIAAAQADLDKSWKDCGWTRERQSEVSDEIGSILAALRSFKSGEINETELAETLGRRAPVSVATLKARFDELENTRVGDLVARQVREEQQQAKAGEMFTVEQLTGRWVVDVEATFEILLGSTGAATAEMMSDFQKTVGKTSYTFGPGDRIVASAPRADGTLREDIGTYRLDGRKVWFKSPKEKAEQSLDVGMHKGKLQFGTGLALIVFRKE